MLDKIVKNNMIMGVVAIVTLALVAYIFVQTRKSNTENTAAAPAAEPTPTEE